ncbi:F-box/kelch-repeat protein At1g57790-like [Chenopodium quinoa]|uniref:F-box/kelch-repeat protein At1g57790-like n=1 Tax=Chenopodium quinoa TaxID=63459 RepID=UPI000B772457|nr:F-box/kelch-repeat protein At1g57790-like [Chenopodium quinoa]
MDPSREDSHSMILDLSLDPFIIDFTKDGWLVLSIAKTQSIQFCNPLTRVKGDYPPNEEVRLYNVGSIGFSTNPTSPDCVTVKFVYEDDLVIYYHRYGDKRWTRFDVDNYDNEFSVGTGSPVYFNGAFYVLDRNLGHLGAFELVDGGGSWNIYHTPVIPFAHFHSTQLSVVENSLLYSLAIWDRESKCSSLTILKKHWVDVQNLGNYSLVIHRSSSISIPTSDDGMRN